MCTKINQRTFEKYCEEGNIIVACRLYQTDPSIMISNWTFCLSCTKSLEVAQWIYQIGDPESSSRTSVNLPVKGQGKIDIHFNDEEPLMIACRNNRLEIVQWLFSLSHEIGSPINIHTDNDKAFYYCCDYGYIDLAQFLFQASDQSIDIHQFNEYFFNLSCQQGHYEFATWLHQLGHDLKSPININANRGFLFKWICEENYLDLAKWLFNLYIDENHDLTDIKALISEIFEQVCLWNHYEMMTWVYHIAYRIGSPIQISDDLFLKVCKNNEFVIASWFAKNVKRFRLNLTGKVAYSIEKSSQIALRIIDTKYKKALRILEISSRENQINETCLICYDDQLSQIIELPCHHYYCLKCILHWTDEHEEKCLYCFKPFKYQDCINYRKIDC